MTFKVLLLPGDGIGPEIIQQAEETINCLDNIFDLNIEIEKGYIGGAAIDAFQTPTPDETLSMANHANAILLGAVGGPKWDDNPPDMRPEKGLLQLRKYFNLFANLRPAIMYDHLVDASSLNPNLVKELDLMIIRELTGGLYFGEPRGIETKSGVRVGYNTMIYYEPEIERIAHVAFEIARNRNKKVCSVDKANVLEVSQLWRDVVTKVHKNYDDVELTHMYVDHAAMQLIQQPKFFDVILTENMFGDILSDCAAVLTGSIGLLPSASINDAEFGLYEPVHGSAPLLAGKNEANPIATLLSLSMMLRYSMLRQDAADALVQAVDQVLEQGLRTKDIANEHSTIVGTSQMGEAIRDAIEQQQTTKSATNE